MFIQRLYCTVLNWQGTSALVLITYHLYSTATGQPNVQHAITKAQAIRNKLEYTYVAQNWALYQVLEPCLPIGSISAQQANVIQRTVGYRQINDVGNQNICTWNLCGKIETPASFLHNISTVGVHTEPYTTKKEVIKNQQLHTFLHVDWPLF